MCNYTAILTKGNSCCHLKGWNKIVIALTLICGVLWFDERTHFYALHNNNAEWRELLEHETFSASSFQMHSQDNLAVMSHYSHIIEEMTVYSFRFEFYLRRLCFSFYRLVTFEYVYVWWHLSIPIQEALLIPQVRQSHQTGCLLKSFTLQHSIPFICQPSCLYMLFINWLQTWLYSPAPPANRLKRCPATLQGKCQLMQMSS